MFNIESIQKNTWAREPGGFVIHSPVSCARGLQEFQEAIGNAHLIVDGVKYRVKGVEIENLEEPLNVGEVMGIIVEGPDADT